MVSRRFCITAMRLCFLLSAFVFGILGIIGSSSSGSGSGQSNSEQSGQVWYGSTSEDGEVFFRTDDSMVKGFGVNAYLSGGSSGSGWLWLNVGDSMPISGSSFRFNNSNYDVSGKFVDSSSSTGSWDYHEPYMGYSKGTWTAKPVPELLVSPTSQNVLPTSGSTSFTVSNTSEHSGNMTWTAELDDSDSWLNIASGSVGTNTGTISVSFEENSGGDARFGTLTIASPEAYNSPKTVEIRQRVFNPYPETKITALDGTYDAEFGASIEISGDYTIIGARGENDDTGSAYIFQQTGEEWFQKAKLTASDGQKDDRFGQSVSISGDYVVIGALRGSGNNINTGSAYVFQKPAGGWQNVTETAKLTASDGFNDDYFGSAVSVSGDHIVVGAMHNGTTWSKTGSAYIFTKPAGGWTDMTETAKLTASDAYDTDYLGCSASMSGDVVIIGAYDSNYIGAAYIFEKPPGGWTDMTETAKLTASDGGHHDRLGYSVSLSGSTAIVGAYWDDSNGSNSGSAYIFEKPVGGWADMTETAKLTASDGQDEDYFGHSVSISVDTAAVGAYWDSSNGPNSGSAYIFKKPVGGWQDMTDTAKLTASDGEKWDRYGYAVSISGIKAIVGAYEANNAENYSGSAYIYTLE